MLFGNHRFPEQYPDAVAPSESENEDVAGASESGGKQGKGKWWPEVTLLALPVYQTFTCWKTGNQTLPIE